MSASTGEHPLSFPLTVLQRVYYPELALPALSKTRVLILGAGTLGTHLARSLLAWGVRYFTFVDSGTVSLTNPLRQPLFSHADVGSDKAGAAAAGLAALAPADYIFSRSVRLAIPTPGFGSPEEVDVVALAGHICDSDIVFSVTDTRAARFVPALLCRHFGKPCLTVALGIDHYLVSRACFFCVDVSAGAPAPPPRPLPDFESCTVSRPCLAPAAAAAAAALVACALSHPRGWAAPHEGAGEGGPLGPVFDTLRANVAAHVTVLAAQPRAHGCPCCGAAAARLAEGGLPWLARWLRGEGGELEVEALGGGGGEGSGALPHAAAWDEEEDL